jgi:hypothetical protein
MTNEFLLTDPEELLYRQVHSSWRKPDGSFSSQVFKPTPKDKGCMSVDRSSKVSAQTSFEHHQSFGVSVAVLGVTVGEVTDVGLSSIDDVLVDKPAHAYIDMTGKSRGQIEGLAGKLRDLAVDRGVLHPLAAEI